MWNTYNASLQLVPKYQIACGQNVSKGIATCNTSKISCSQYSKSFCFPGRSPAFSTAVDQNGNDNYFFFFLLGWGVLTTRSRRTLQSQKEKFFGDDCIVITLIVTENVTNLSAETYTSQIPQGGTTGIWMKLIGKFPSVCPVAQGRAIHLHPNTACQLHGRYAIQREP